MIPNTPQLSRGVLYLDTLWVGRKDQEAEASAEGLGESWWPVSETRGPGCVLFLIIDGALAVQ